MDEERRILEGVELARFGPFDEVPSGLEGGPRTLYRGASALVWIASAARIAAERAGRAIAADHPAAPLVLAETERAIAFAPTGAVVSDPIAFARSWPRAEIREIEGVRREILRALDPSVNAARALGKIARRKYVDRWLDARVALHTRVGISFGGVPPSWLRVQADRAVCMRCDRIRRDGWMAIDLAGLALDPGIDLGDLRAAHEGDAEAFELALVLVRLREHAITSDPALAEEIAAQIAEPREAARVRVWIDAPSFVDSAVWNPPGELVAASRARWLLRELDGLSVGGGEIHVRTEPKIRAGRSAPLREDRRARRARLFSRFHEGVEVDDEGLVSATPEALARAMAKGARGVVLDATCGIGSLAIAFAREAAVERVIAVDRDRQRLEMAAHNASIYGVRERIELVCADAIAAIERTPADLLVLDPPWGGRDYDRRRVSIGDLDFDLARAIAIFPGSILIKLPRSFDVATLPAGFSFEAAIDERGILKFIVARRPARG
jgi:hypothetical protein